MSKIPKYKKKRLNLQEDVDQKQLRLHRKSIHQKEARGNLVNERRGLVEMAPALASSEDAKLRKQQMLQKYKEEKLLKKKLEAEKKKPAFKFCKIKYDMPAFINVTEPPKVNDKPGVLTRGMAKALANVQPPQSAAKVNTRLAKLRDNVQASGSSAITRQRCKLPKPAKKPVQPANVDVPTNEEPRTVASIQSRKSFAPDNFQFVAPANLSTYPFTPINNRSKRDESLALAQVESSASIAAPSEDMSNETMTVEPVLLNSASSEEISNEIIAIAPVEPLASISDPRDEISVETIAIAAVEPVTSISAPVEEISAETLAIAAVEPVASISAPNDEASGANTENAKTTTYFRDLSAATISKLTELREKWSEISKVNQELISENVFGKIDTVVGQTTLLITKKFKQFFGLIDDCDNGTGEQITLIDDLQGFWDMMYFQVEDLNEKYKKLDEIMANDWVETVSPVKRFKPQNKGRRIKPSTNVRVNKTQEARLRLAKTKVFNDKNIFSLPVDNGSENTTEVNVVASSSTEIVPVQNSVDENPRLSEMKSPEKRRTEPLVRLSERQSFFQQISTRENLPVDKETLSTLFSPLKTETDKYSATVDVDLIRFSNAHCFANKENVTN